MIYYRTGGNTMTFYQELQLNQAGSKNYISSFKEPKEKLKHIAIYLFKIIINVAFSSLFIMLFSILFGIGNSIVGLAVLLSIMAFRFSDLGIRMSHSIFCMFMIFGILAVGPKISNSVPVGWSFCVNIVCIMLLMLFGSHNVVMFNHSTFVLSYLLIQGYDVSGHTYKMRLLGLFFGAVLTSVILYHKHRKIKYKRSLKSIFQEFNLSSTRTRWQIRMTLVVSSALLIANILGVPKAYWMGIAAMSVTFPFKNEIVERVKFRAIGNILGCVLFVAVYFILPESLHGFIGIIGGIGTGLSVSYGWQTAFNSMSAISIAISVLGIKYAILFRIFNNIFSAVYTLLFYHIFEPAVKFVNNCFGKLMIEANSE